MYCSIFQYIALYCNILQHIYCYIFLHLTPESQQPGELGAAKRLFPQPPPPALSENNLDKPARLTIGLLLVLVSDCICQA